jgi:hypothetical protein
MLKMAADEKAPSGWQPTFVGAPAGALLGLRTKGKDRKIVPRGAKLTDWFERTSGGLSEIDLRNFDAVVVYGLALKTQDALATLGQFQPLIFRFGSESRLISETAFSALIDAHYKSSTAVHVLGLIKDCGKPIILAPSPLPNENLLLRSDYQWAKTKEGKGAAKWATDLCREKWRALAREFGATLLLQPNDTIVDDYLTIGEYAVGATRLTGVAYNDPTHLNSTFGHIALENIGDVLLGVRTNSGSPPGLLDRLLGRRQAVS